MILDKENLFCENQAVTVSAPSENVIDLGENAGEGQAVEILAQAAAAFDAAGSASLTVALQHSDAPDTGFTDLLTVSAGKEDLRPGYQFPLGILPHRHKRYLRLDITVTDGPMTAGAITAGLVLTRQSFH